MFKYISLKDQLLTERAKSNALKRDQLKQQADIDYIAMMSDIELALEEAEDEQI
jgi:hypothetical protein